MRNRIELDEVTKKPKLGLQKIVREPIIGFVVTDHKRDDGSHYISTKPLCGSRNDLDNDLLYQQVSIDSADRVIGVIPAPAHSYEIIGLFPCEGQKYPEYGEYKLLGYDYDGVDNPDWNVELEYEIDRRKQLL